jgi:hypothetical protein
MSDITDDVNNKLSVHIENDFGTKKEVDKITELLSFRCSNCRYHNLHDIHNIKTLTCGCSKEMDGRNYSL